MVKYINIEKGTKELIPYFSAKGVMSGLYSKNTGKGSHFS